MLVTLRHQSAQAQFNLLDELKKKTARTNAVSSLSRLTEDQTTKAWKEVLAESAESAVKQQAPPPFKHE